ncbi:MAG TPA: hypothetical protein VFU43_01500 [Streptosporangiaceae bacterium]|nr:hypothetical protein [Streptosporangiaceae bacterium]
MSDIGGKRPPPPAAAEPEIALRFGPGVQPEDTNPLIEKWRAGQVRRAPRRRRGWARNLLSSIVTIVIVGGVALWLLLRGQGAELEITAIKVRAPQATQPCDATVDVVGVLTTNGKRGEISYRWHRSDGNESGVLSASAEKGRHEVAVPLHWTVTGQGKLHAVATLELLSPGDSRRVSASFDYLCR